MMMNRRALTFKHYEGSASSLRQRQPQLARILSVALCNLTGETKCRQGRDVKGRVSVYVWVCTWSNSRPA